LRAFRPFSGRSYKGLHRPRRGSKGGRNASDVAVDARHVFVRIEEHLWGASR